LGTNSLYKLIAYYFNLHIIAYLLYICTTYKAHIDAFLKYFLLYWLKLSSHPDSNQ